MADGWGRRVPWGWVSLGVLAAVAAQQRVGWWGFGFTSDEVANVPPGGLAEVWSDPETAVNPPLMRALMLVGSEAQSPWVGRGVSLVSGVIASALAAVAGAGRGRWAGGALAGALVALHPISSQVSGEARAYALWTALLLLHALAVGRLVEGGTSRAAWTLSTATALLLPWTHYLAVPMLAAGTGLVLLSGRAAAAVPGVIGLAGALPLVPWVLAGSERRTPAMEPVPAVMDKLLGLGLIPPRALNNPISMTVKSWTGHTPFWPVVMTASVIGLWVLATLAWRRLTWTQRVSWAQALGLAAGVAWTATFQHVRPPVTAALVAALAPVLGGLVGAVPGRLGWGCAAAVGGWLLWEQPLMRAELWNGRAEGDGIGAFAEALRAGEVSAPRVHVWPFWQLPALYFTLYGRSIAHAEPPVACAGARACFAWGDGLVVGVEGQAPTGAGLSGPLVAVDIVRDPRIGSACAPAKVALAWRSWSCGAEP